MYCAGLAISKEYKKQDRFYNQFNYKALGCGQKLIPTLKVSNNKTRTVTRFQRAIISFAVFLWFYHRL